MSTDKLRKGQDLLKAYREMQTAREMYTASPDTTTYLLYRDTKKTYDNLCKEIAKDLEQGHSPEMIKDAKTDNNAVKPPVEIGDTVYFIMNGEVYKTTVVLLSWTQYSDKSIRSEIRGEVCPFHTFGATWDEWGKVVFGTEEEAKVMLTKKDECV